ncbi:hypothetical protein [Bartonella rattimassiliensis]|uniref:Uncharacterized protein n=1 Tax=Bartonella rattimassiliensis 15908 TaxID=1094556 RepID=J0ZHS6_9HYPH|nr:hypothetical protein [Bartonella rattimassiliensis]EJF87723.1 hypothetical protein MCY_00177 [Bartonella rattimassiliensis 15908]
MIVLDFIIFSAVSISNTPPTAFSVFIEQELQSGVYVTSDNDKLLRQSSPFRKTTAKNRQFKQSKHNFDANLKQNNVEYMKWFSPFDTFNFCKNLKNEETTFAYHYEPIMYLYNSKKDMLQSVLSFYDMRHLNAHHIKKASSFFEVKTALLIGDKTSQESVEIHERKQRQITKQESLPLPKEELEDAFMHKASSANDIFVTEGSSLLKKQQE